MENFKIESRYLKLCDVFRAVIRCMRAAFYRPDYQKFLMCPLIKRLGPAFVSKLAAKLLKHSAEPLQHLDELFKHSAELLRVQEITKSSAESLKSSTTCLCYSTAHAVPISHGNIQNPVKHLR